MRDRENKKLGPCQRRRAESPLTHMVQTAPKEKQGQAECPWDHGQTGDVKRVPGRLWSGLGPGTAFLCPRRPALAGEPVSSEPHRPCPQKGCGHPLLSHPFSFMGEV